MKITNALLALSLAAAACTDPATADVTLRQGAVTAAQCAYFEANGKTQICHATGSAAHPYTILKTSEQGCINGHANHPGDYIAVDDPTCQGGGCLPQTAPCDATLPCCDGLSCLAGTCQAPPPPPSAFATFPLPNPECYPFRIAAGADGNLWFTESNCNNIGRITPAGVITEFPLPTPDSAPQDVTLGPDGNIWFTEFMTGSIGKITPAGVITEYPNPGAGPFGIAAGPDGNLWFTDLGERIKRITLTGDLTSFQTPTSFPYTLDITAGPDGNLWFTEEVSGNVGRITLDGVITEFPAVTPAGPLDNVLRGITAGPDGNLWFTTGDHNEVGRITTAGAVTLFALPGAPGWPDDIAPGPDGNLWFTEYLGNKLGRITPAGAISEVTIVPAESYPAGIVTGPDGAIWFTSFVGNSIGRYQP